MHARVVGVAVAASMLFSACTGGAGAGPSTGPDRAPGGTLRVGISQPAYFALDPQNEWIYSSWELFRCCLLRTLMSYDGMSAPSGTQPKPDLAADLPDVSPDGLTWTFHLRPGLHYGPPLQAVPITSPDVVRALLRAGDPTTSNTGLSASYLSDIAGFSEYVAGRSDSISGLETPDDRTLRIHEVRPDSTLAYEMTLATTAPIPPSPTNPDDRFGVAAGHDRSPDPSKQDGYGRVLVSSGPYMIEGEAGVDFSRSPAQQGTASGFVPWSFDRHFDTRAFGSITLVRNPSWDPATDPLRPANADRIVLVGGDAGDLYRRLRAGDLDTVFDENPPPDMLSRYLSDPSLRPSVRTLDTNNLVNADFNVARPPFDDPRVRRAVADALDRRAMLDNIETAYGFASVQLANHYSDDASELSLASGWTPFPTQDGRPDIPAARRALAGSPYARAGRCVASVCQHVLVEMHQGLDASRRDVERALAALGIHATVRVPDDLYDVCSDNSVPWGICIGDGWFPDFPSTGNGLIWFFAGPSIHDGISFTHLGAPRSALRRLGLPVVSVPTVDPQIRVCQEEVGESAVACWTRLDQYLVTQLMPAVPLAFGQIIRLTSRSIGGFSWDQGFQAPALDRLRVVAST